MIAELFLVAPANAETDGFVVALARLLDAEKAAALFLPRGDRDEAQYRAFAEAVLPVAQARDCAVLLDNDAALAKNLGADGVHVSLGIIAVQQALALLKPDMIVGAGALHSRHDAMMKAEAGVDYVFFGDIATSAAGLEEIDAARWWAETFEVPCVLFEAGRDAAGTGAEFAALGPSAFAPEPGR
jgi:thiamine-phosphate pyrophosphorylase